VTGPASATGLVVAGLTVVHPGARPALSEVSLTALHEVSLVAEPGEQLVVLGRSGAGKTTLLHALLGAGPREAGTVRVGGLDPYDPAQRLRVRRSTGLVLQGGDLVPRVRARTAALSGSSHLFGAAGWWALARGRVPAPLAPRLAQLAGEQGVEQLLDRPVAALSGGERQRVALVRALLGGPGLLLADEPTAGLDPASADAAVSALLAQRATLVVTTHDPLVAARFPRVVALRDGQVVHDGGALSAVQAEQLYARA